MLRSDAALYLPAVSDAYSRYAPGSSFARTVPLVPDDLNFLDPGNRLFYYPYALTSAGQSKGAISKTPDMFSTRNRGNTVVLADSGGFQIQNGQMPFKGTATTKKMLSWMEHVGDYSMILDFPTGGIDSGSIGPHRERLEKQGYGPAIAALNAQNQLGLDFNTCLQQTIINNDDFVQHRVPGKTRLLNVLQGRNEAESKTWYEAVKHYPFEDWSLAGGHQTSFTITLNRIFDMIRDRKLQDCEWLHVLGISKPWSAVLLSILQNCIREYINPKLQISYDSASPFRGAAKNTIYTGYIMDKLGWSFRTEMLPDMDPRLLGLSLNDAIGHYPVPKEAELFENTSVARRVIYARTQIGDIITPRDILQLPNSGADTTGIALLMNHNVQVLLDAFQEANELMASYRPEAVPRNLPPDYLAMAILIRDLFDKHRQNPYPFIQDAARFFDRYAHL